MNEDNIREKTDLELEREELNLLVKQGVRFSVTHKIRRHKKGVKGFFQTSRSNYGKGRLRNTGTYAFGS